MYLLKIYYPVSYGERLVLPKNNNASCDFAESEKIHTQESAGDLTRYSYLLKDAAGEQLRYEFLRGADIHILGVCILTHLHLYLLI